MPGRFDNTGAYVGRRRLRARLGGMFANKTCRTIGFASIAAPIVGYIINDLKKPDSVISGLIGSTVSKLLRAKPEKVEAIDITDKVEILEINSDKRS